MGDHRVDERSAERGSACKASLVVLASWLAGCATPQGPAPPMMSSTERVIDVDAASCAILNLGNQRYVEENYAAAIDAYRTVELIDRHGKSGCTASIYASIATCYGILGDRQLASDALKAAEFFRSASRYNRAFAYAVDCELRDCKNSIEFWK